MNKKYSTHLSLEDRKNIELGIIEGLSKTQIAKKINRHPSTIAKEILKNWYKSSSEKVNASL